MKYYTFELVDHVLRGGRPWELAVLAWRIGRGKFLRQHRSVFHLGLNDLPQVPEMKVPDYVLQSFLSWRDMDETLRKELAANPREIWWNAQAFLDDGGRIWIGRHHGRLANVGCSRTGDRVGFYFFPLMSSWVVFSHFVTLPAFRGRGLFQSLLAAMIHQLAMARIDRFFIDCHDWNVASIRGIARTGFRRLGTGVISRGGRVAWLPAVPTTGRDGARFGAASPLAGTAMDYGSFK